MPALRDRLVSQSHPAPVNSLPPAGFPDHTRSNAAGRLKADGNFHVDQSVWTGFLRVSDHSDYRKRGGHTSTIAVIGATGTAGSRVIARLLGRGVAVVEVARACGVDVTTTHCHEFATNPAAVTFNDREVLVQDWLIQPIAADTVADVLVEAALAQTRRPRTITGPHAIRLPVLTSKLLALQGDRRRVRAVQPALTALAVGALLAPDHATTLGPDVDTWLTTLVPPAATTTPTARDLSPV